MKQTLFAAFAAVAVLTSSCSKNDGGGEPEPAFPIQGLEMPASSAENPIIAGTTVNIKGVGFTALDEIWFGTPAKASDGVKAEGFKLTATGISFTAPAIDGQTGVTLKQAGKAYLLGNLFFSTGGQPSKTEHLYAIRSFGTGTNTSTESGSEFGEYNMADGTFKSVFKMPVFVESAIADDRSNIYYITYDVNEELAATYLIRYNLIEKKEVRLITFKDENPSIGIIDGKLHLMRQDKTNGFRLMLVADDGKETLVKTFGQVPDAGYVFYENEDVRFVYDETSKSVLLTGKSEYGPYNDGKGNTASTILSFSLETGAIVAKHEQLDVIPNTATWFNVAKTDAGVLLFTITITWSTVVEVDDTEVGETVITYIDPTTLTKKSDVATVACEFDRPTYVASKNRLIGIDTRHYEPYVAWSYDLTAKNIKEVNSTENFECFFTMSY